MKTKKTKSDAAYFIPCRVVVIGIASLFYGILLVTVKEENMIIGFPTWCLLVMFLFEFVNWLVWLTE